MVDTPQRLQLGHFVKEKSINMADEQPNPHNNIKGKSRTFERVPDDDNNAIPVRRTNTMWAGSAPPSDEGDSDGADRSNASEPSNIQHGQESTQLFSADPETIKTEESRFSLARSVFELLGGVRREMMERFSLVREQPSMAFVYAIQPQTVTHRGSLMSRQVLSSVEQHAAALKSLQDYRDTLPQGSWWYHGSRLPGTNLGTHLSKTAGDAYTALDKVFGSGSDGTPSSGADDCTAEKTVTLKYEEAIASDPGVEYEQRMKESGRLSAASASTLFDPLKALEEALFMSTK